MAKLGSSRIDVEAFRQVAAESGRLREMLQDIGNEIAARDRAFVAAHHNRYHNLPYKVTVRVITGRDGLPAVKVTAPVNAFLGTRTGLRRQLYSYGHRLQAPLLHAAGDYILRDALESIEGSPLSIFG